MIDDPIVEEIRKYRKEHAAKYGNDLSRIVEAFREKERSTKRPLVSFKPNPLPKQKRVQHVAEDGSLYSANK